MYMQYMKSLASITRPGVLYTGDDVDNNANASTIGLISLEILGNFHCAMYIFYAIHCGRILLITVEFALSDHSALS